MKSPELDSFILPLGETVELKTVFHSVGPAGMRLMMNGDLVITDSLSPVSSEAVIPFSPDEPGDYSVQLIVEAAPLDELRKVSDGEHPEDEIVSSASWNITVVEKDQLNQDDFEEFKQQVATATMAYTLLKIPYKVFSNYRLIVEIILGLLKSENSESGTDPQSTIDEFDDSEPEDDNS